MDNREAKFILSAYRPNGQDSSDPHFGDALAQARRDPILQHWFEDSVALDSAMTELLHAVPAPADLRENILAGAKLNRASHWKKRFVKWAIAAVLMLGASVGLLIWHNAQLTRLAGWQTQALEVISSLVRSESKFDAQSSHRDELVTWLRTNNAPAAEKVPDKIDKLTSLGCKTFSWNGTPVSVICFTRPDGGLIHLVTANVPARSTDLSKTAPQFVQHDEWATATWREGDKIYMLALEGSSNQLRGYL